MAGEKVIPKYQTRAHRAGLTFSVARVHRKLRDSKYCKHIGTGGSVYLAAVLEYLVAEVVELGGVAASVNKRVRITPRHLNLAVQNDSELTKLFEGVIIAEGGVIPHIEPFLMPLKSK